MLRIVCAFSQDTGVRDVQISGKIAPLSLFAHTKSGILRRLSALRIFTLQRKTKSFEEICQIFTGNE